MATEQLRSQIRALEDRQRAVEKGHLWQAIGEVTLRTGNTTTTVEHHGCSSGSVVLLAPMNANAAAENAFTTPAKGSFVITHANAATTRTFRYIVFTGVRQ